MRTYRLLLFLLLAGICGGCVKEKYALDINDNTNRVISEFTEGDTAVMHSFAMDFSSGLVEFDLTELRILPRSNASKDVQVQVAVNPVLLNTYNSDNGTSFEIPPASVFQLSSSEFTLPAIGKTARLKVKLDPSAVAGNSYALAFTITQVSDGEISALRKDYLVELKVKNAFDGVYHATGTLTRYNGPTTASPVAGVIVIDEEKTLSTVDVTTSDTEMGQYGFTGGFMFLEVDPVSFAVTVTPSGISPTFPSLTNAGTCSYDPVTKTFTLMYSYLNGAGNIRVIEEIMELQ
ncbi:MAG TPA: DUF1735 domain-containing protein [Ferruginibacter sp.]|nr:DUF1735 domain-containing protein [Ferruginibacter sp.]